MVGVVIFTDLADDANHYALPKEGNLYPCGPRRNPSFIERGSVQYLNIYPGDPTTPGYASHEDVEREDTATILPNIPSLPISFRDAQHIIDALEGHGHRPGELEPDPIVWHGALDADYYTGPNLEATLTLTNIMEDKYTPIHNVIGVLHGTNDDEVVIVGNHRDAWTVGGAGDPNSGSAIMIELSKAFNELTKTGWRPRRSIIPASWDMEEYGLVGSTEFVEDHLPWLKDKTVAYLNIDIACGGPVPHVTATPELHNLITTTMKRILWPNIGSADLFPDQTLYSVWASLSGQVRDLGSGSDYTAFLHNGISAVDIGSHGEQDDPTYHYHSIYDSYAWMQKYGDPEFNIHIAMGRWLALLTYHLADDPIIPFEPMTYVLEMQQAVSKLQDVAVNSKCCTTLDVTSVSKAIETFQKAAFALDTDQTKTVDAGNQNDIERINKRYKNFQRAFVGQGGLPGREFYKHIIYAPGMDTGYAAVTFPGITEAVTVYEDLEMANQWVEKTANGIVEAANILAD